MKCTLCKYVNMANEAARHPNGTTVFFAQALRNKVDRHKICDNHGDKFSSDVESGNSALSKARELGYVALEHVWYKAVWIPKGERL